VHHVKTNSEHWRENIDLFLVAEDGFEPPTHGL
jgi:hypothetical protein